MNAAFSRILVPVDGTACGAGGVRYALELARAWGATAVLAHVVPAPVALEQPAWAVGLRLLAFERERARALGVPAETRLLGSGPVADALVAAAREARCDLIAMATHGREGLPRVVLGSVAGGVVRRATVPVLLSRHQGGGTRVDHLPIRRVLAAVDGGDAGLETARVAERVAAASGAPLELLHVIPDLALPPYAASLVGADAGRMQRDLAAEAEAILHRAARHAAVRPSASIVYVSGEPVADAIVRTARERRASLIVVAAHNRGTFDRLLLGSVSERVAHRSGVPVVVLRGTQVERTAERPQPPRAVPA